MIGWLARWFRYQGALSRLTGEVFDAGYTMSPPAYERIKAKARAGAGLPPQQRCWLIDWARHRQAGPR